MNSHLTFFSVFISLAGINKQIAVDAMYIPVVSSSEPQAVGLPQDPHGNTMLSCLSSGFLCPLSNTANNSEETLPRPGSHCGGDNVHSGSICWHMHLLHLIFKMCVFWVFFLQRKSWQLPVSLKTHMSCASLTFVTWVEIRWKSWSARCTGWRRFLLTRRYTRASAACKYQH